MTDLLVVLPGDWWVVPLTAPDGGAASIARLVDRQFAGVDDRPHLKAEARAQLQEQAAEAAGHGAVRLSLSLQLAGDMPLAASLVERPVDGASFDALQEELAEEAETARTEVAAGRLARRLRRATSSDVTTLVVDYWVERPDRSGLAHLAFSTPLVVLEEPLLGMFDAVVTTGRWAG